MKLEEQFLISEKYIKVSLEELNEAIFQDFKKDNPNLSKEEIEIKKPSKKVIHIWEE